MPAETILKFLDERPGCRVALAAHQRPDGDAAGSCMGLAAMLRANGYQAKVLCPSPLPSNLSFIVDRELLLAPDSPQWWRDFDCFGILDCGDLTRVDEVNREAAENLPTFNIDHHVTSSGVGQAIWIAPEASSVGEMVVELCLTAGWKLTRQAAMALWTSIASDTGRFSYENTTPAALAAARECVLAGAEPALSSRELFQSVSIGERKLQTRVLERLELHENGRLGLSWLRRSDFEDAGIGIEGAQDLINLVRDTAGVEVAIFLYEPAPDSSGRTSVKISLRAQSPHDALVIAQKYGGGGHKRAAGGSLQAPMDATRKEVIAAAVSSYFS